MAFQPARHFDRLFSLNLASILTKIFPNIVDYRARKKQGLAFTSHLAESTVESLINQRCKGQQHMRWTRDGIHPLLQLRAFIASNDWCVNWQEKILGAMTNPAY